MKKLLCAILTGALVLGLAACGNSDSGEFKMPDFDEEALTEAQALVKRAVDKYEIESKSLELKTAKVMFTDDLAKDLAEKVDITTWDVSTADAVVVLYLGQKEDTADSSSSSSTVTTAADASTSSDATGTEDKADESKLIPVVYVMAEDESYLYYRTGEVAQVDSISMAEDVVIGGDVITEAKKNLAQCQLDTENYLAQNAELLGEYPAFLQGKITENPDYLYSLDYFGDLAAQNPASQMSVYAYYLRNEYRAEMKLNALTAENPKAEDLVEEDVLLMDEKFSLLNELYKVKGNIANLDATSAEALAEYKAVLETVKEKEDYLFDETLARAALANETANTYDNYLRQQYVYQTSLDELERVLASADDDEREYIAARSELVTTNMSNYSNMFKTYVQCLLNLENFEAANAESMAAYDAEVAAVMEAEGEGYENSVAYMKVELKYQDMLTSLEGFKNAIPLAKADLDAMKTEQDTALAELDAEEQERIDEEIIIAEKNAFWDYVSGNLESTNEYQVVKGQWGEVHPDYITYQNQDLNYYTPKSSSSGSSYKGSSSGGSSAAYGEDSDWANYDYDGDGEINGSEFEAGMSDAIDKMYNEMMGY